MDFSKPRIVWQIIGSIQEIVEQESSSARQTIASDLKGESLTLSAKLIEEEDKINYILNNIEIAQNQLLQVENKKQGSLDYITATKTNIQTINQSLTTLLNSNQIPAEYLNQINNAVSEVNTIQSDLNLLESSINENSPQNSRLKLNQVENDLEETKNSITNIRDNLNNLNNADINKISEPITLSYQSILDSESKEIENKLNNLDYIFPSFLMFFLVFGSIIFAAILRIRERTSNAYIRNILSKAKGHDFILSEFITTSILLIIQIGIILLIASYFLNLSLITELIPTSILILIAITIFTLIGTTIGQLIDSQESLFIATVSLSILFFIFSSIIIPVETLPQPFSTGAGLLPLTLFETKIRASIIFSQGLNFSLKEIIAALAWIIIPITLIAISYTCKKRKEI